MPKKSSTLAVPPPGCALVPPTLIEPRGFTATLFRAGRVSRTEWHVEPDGRIRSFSSDSGDDAPRAKKGRRVVLKSRAPAVSSEPARPAPRIRSVPGARYQLSGAPRRCSLTLPGEAPRRVEMQWYDFDSPVERFAILSPVRAAGWMLVLANVMFSPGRDWLAPAMGDLDGDGRTDLAFVSEGVGCDGKLPTDCPALWVNVFLSAADTSSLPTLVSMATEDRLLHELGLPLDDRGAVKLRQSSRWRGRIRRGAYEIAVSGPKRRHKWTAVLRDGKLTLEGARHGG